MGAADLITLRRYSVRVYIPHYWEKNRKTFFDFLSPLLGINVSLFRLRQFGEVGSELGSPMAGVEIGTG